MLSTTTAILALLFLLATAVVGELTEHACWQRNCLIRNDAGTLCFVSSANGIPPTQCEDPVVVHVLEAHINSDIGLSIAYYDQRARFLGSITWPVPSPLPFQIYVCSSGRRGDVGAYRTPGGPRARVEYAQTVVADGCYIPASANPPSEQKSNTSFLDSPVVVHMFFVLGGILTTASLVAGAVRYRASLRWILGHIGAKATRGSKRIAGAVLMSITPDTPESSPSSSLESSPSGDSDVSETSVEFVLYQSLSMPHELELQYVDRATQT
ncbi:hypothetical protein EXIGLDRAFT_691679 [Exidia glandulosa HHB12029]|uniref:Autophagy-related protein 27 n=1 Tax=Exidia glandulosa HHB12029 TaxID=1314781 RepID=A0A165P492_EXIGL|nr:hypothetical protein EXIGLDRAFT_691679 [Exidia glandulosa HHB12029]